MCEKVTVLLPIYGGDNPEDLDEALNSVVQQTRQPDEILIVQDGPVPESIATIVERYRREYPVTRHVLDTNQGLPTALREGIRVASNDYIARMDSDDLSTSDRIRKQANTLDRNPSLDVVGGQLLEVDPETKEIQSRREVPTDHREIERMAKHRSPMNHGTVMMRRDAVLAAGNYRRVRRMEDYDLWVRMIMNGSKFKNLPDVLLHARGGNNLYSRRGGFEYAREEVARQTEFFRRGFITLPQFIFNLLARVSIRFFPDLIRKYIYRLFARPN